MLIRFFIAHRIIVHRIIVLMDKAKPRSQRQLKVGEEIRRILSDAFMRGDFYVMGQKSFSITVSEVKVSPDLHNASVYVMPLAGKDKKEVMEYLKALQPELRRTISKKLMLRVVPRLLFMLDESFEEAHKMNTIFNKPEVARDLIKKEE